MVLTVKNSRIYMDGVKRFLNGVNLFHQWYDAWSNPDIDRQLDLIRQTAFNHVRILVSGNFIRSDGSVNPAYEAKTKYFMDACKKRGIIVNFVPHPQWGGGWGRLQDGAVNYNFYNGSAKWLKANGYDNAFIEVIWEVGTWVGDWDQTNTNSSLFRSTIEKRAKACKDGYPGILTAAMMYGWSSTVNMPFRPTVLMEPSPVVDIFDYHDYSGSAKESQDTLANMAKYLTVATVSEELGGGYKGYSVVGEWAILKAKLDVLASKGAGYAYWAWMDYGLPDKPPWGLVDEALKPKPKAIELFSCWIGVEPAIKPAAVPAPVPAIPVEAGLEVAESPRERLDRLRGEIQAIRGYIKTLDLMYVERKRSEIFETLRAIETELRKPIPSPGEVLARLGITAPIGMPTIPGALLLPTIPPTPLKVYACPYCGKIFDSYEALVAHVKSAHPGKEVPPEVPAPPAPVPAVMPAAVPTEKILATRAATVAAMGTPAVAEALATQATVVAAMSKSTGTAPSAVATAQTNFAAAMKATVPTAMSTAQTAFAAAMKPT